MRCTDCGHDNREGATFCDSCDAELGVSDVSTAVDSATDISLSPDFVGRHREMAELTAALDDALAGRGRMVMLAGEPGIGKTRTAQELAALAEQRGGQVWWGRCYEGEGAPPYWPWVQPMRLHVQITDAEQLRSEMSAGAADIAEIVSEVRERLPDLEPSPALEPEAARFRLFDSITTFLKNASRTQPLVLVLDDLHWADASSLLLLEFLAREIAQCPMLLVGTYRDVEVSRRHPLSRTLGSLMREHPFQRMQLRGLTQQDARRFVEATVGVIPPAALVEEVHRRTEGNPLFLGEVVGLLTPEEVQEGRWSASGIPEGIRDAIGRRLDLLSRDCDRLLTTASVIGREFDFRLLGALSQDVNESQLLEALDEALEAHVVEEASGRMERYQFSHSLIQQTLLEELSTSRRVRLHATIGEALEEMYGTEAEAHAAELAHHFAEAQTALGPEKSVRYSLIAGERALAAYAWEDALAHFERALAAKEGQLPSAGSGHGMDAEAATILKNLGRVRANMPELHQRQEGFNNIRRAFDHYVDSGDLSEAVTVARQPIIMAGITGLTSFLTRALELVSPDTRDAGALLSRFGLALSRERADHEGALEAFDEALRIAHREGDVGLEALTLGRAASMELTLLHPQECIEEGLRAVELAVRIGDVFAEIVARRFLPSALLSLGELREAQLHAAAFLASIERSHTPRNMVMALFWSQVAAQVAGDWGSARSFSDRGLELARTDVSLLGVRAVLEYQLGEFEQGQTHIDRLLDAMSDAGVDALVWEGFASSAATPMVSRITGAIDQLEVAENAAKTVLSRETALPVEIHAARIELALVAVQRNDADVAEEQYSALKPMQGTATPLLAVDRVLGLLAQTTGKLDVASAHFEDALAFCGKSGYRPELAWSCHDFADALLQRNGPGDHQRALELLDEALGISTELGMKPLIQRVTALQERAASVPAKAPAYPDGLTEREVQVLRLIAAGKSNQDIAEELVISVNTVFRHVSNIFSKTGASNRTEAATYATRRGIVS